ncbi:hypothetical protein BJX96DRAFT_140314 [Aspergillus floccosus]
MNHPDAFTRVLNTPELLCMILSHLSPVELLRLQRVSRSWCSLITEAPSLCATTFTGPVPVQHLSKNIPYLNQFVINRLRWSPSLDPTEVNTDQFRSVEANPTLQAMAYRNASWRVQYLTWPPVPKLSIMLGTISQEEPDLPDLVLSSHRQSQDLSSGYEEEEETGNNSSSDESDLDAPPYVLCIEEFPHNADRNCQGISVLDMIYGLRMYYLKYRYTLESYLKPGFGAARGGEVLASIGKYREELLVDVTILNF